VDQIGRWKLAGNTGTPSLKIVDSSLTILASVNVSLSAAADDSWAWAAVPPVTLSAGQTYIIQCQVTSGGDFWYDQISPGSRIAGIASFIGRFGNPDFAASPATPNQIFVPVNFKFRVVP
jgi:hypothetical protein